MAKNVLVLKHFESPKESGTYFRLVCLTGTSKGEAYILSGNRIVIGRGDKVDIKLNDTKASREHAEVTKVGSGWVATDLGSQNGIMVNDKKVTQAPLNEGDKLIVGQTVFKFAKVEVSAKAKVAKEDSEAPTGSGAGKKTLVPLILMAAVFIYMLMDDEKPTGETSGKSKKQTSSSYQDVSGEYLAQLKKRQANEDKAVKAKLNIIYQRGLREFREGNYFRAIAEFNLALIISPGDAYAEYHLRKTKERLDKTIEEFTIRAQRDEGALKFKSSIVSYCSIVRLLYTVPDDPRYKNAEKQIKDIEVRMGMEPDETNCLKKSRSD
ncbi:MAG: FHA domain-containing protein [Bdellovibrionales bacterium]|nr:FHA domain-containing protein [Bdellovibrionales bacterium]